MGSLIEGLCIQVEVTRVDDGVPELRLGLMEGAKFMFMNNPLNTSDLDTISKYTLQSQATRYLFFLAEVITINRPAVPQHRGLTPAIVRQRLQQHAGNMVLVQFNVGMDQANISQCKK